MLPLNNFEYLNKLQVIRGIKRSTYSTVSAYVLECKLKKIIRQHVTIALLGELTKSINERYTTQRSFIKMEDIFYFLQQLDVEILQILLAIYEQDGIMSMLSAIVKTGKEITKKKKKNYEEDSTE